MVEKDIYIMTGNRLKHLREERRLTVADLAKLLGCSEKQYISFEDGSGKINVDQIKIASVFYDVSVDFVVGITEIRKWPAESSLEYY